MKTTSVMQTLSGLSGRLSQGESDFRPPSGRVERSEKRVVFNLPLALETQKQFYTPLKEIAAASYVPFVDQYATTRATLEKLVAVKADNVDPFPDSVHTDSDGGLLMAYAVEKSLEYSGSSCKSPWKFGAGSGLLRTL